jgi:hypothetical protein
MPSGTPFERIRALDVRLIAAVAATLMLILGVMWIVPTTPNSNSFTFDTNRRDISGARTIEYAKTASGSLVDGSDTDFYEVSPTPGSFRLDLHMTASDKLIPALRILDGARTLIQEKNVEYVRQPGATIDTSFSTRSNTAYYIQVFSQRNTTGSYTLTVTQRQP